MKDETREKFRAAGLTDEQISSLPAVLVEAAEAAEEVIVQMLGSMAERVVLANAPDAKADLDPDQLGTITMIVRTLLTWASKDKVAFNRLIRFTTDLEQEIADEEGRSEMVGYLSGRLSQPVLEQLSVLLRDQRTAGGEGGTPKVSREPAREPVIPDASRRPDEVIIDPSRYQYF